VLDRNTPVLPDEGNQARQQRAIRLRHVGAGVDENVMKDESGMMAQVPMI